MFTTRSFPTVFVALAVLFVPASIAAAGSERAAGDSASEIEQLVFPEADMVSLQARGDRVLDELSELYLRSDVPRRVAIASVFYRLGWKSDAAKRALLEDIHTEDESLRLQVQWALGRVSDDPDVVDILIDNMRHDTNPLFRDKAACALSYDQIHLSEKQKLRLYERLIAALSDETPQVRAIAIKSLQIHTGQTKSFRYNAPPEQRARSVREWTQWLDNYRSSF